MAKKKAWKPAQIEIDWIDACGYLSLHGTRGAVLDRAKLVIRQTSGYLIHQDDKRTVLAHDYDAPTQTDDEPEIGNITVIPSGWVLKIKYVKGGKKGETKSGDASGDKPGGGSAGGDSTAAGVSGPSGATSGSDDAHHGQRDEHQSDQKHA